MTMQEVSSLIGAFKPIAVESQHDPNAEELTINIIGDDNQIYDFPMTIDELKGEWKSFGSLLIVVQRLYDERR